MLKNKLNSFPDSTSTIRQIANDTVIKIGIYFTPDFMFPFLIIEIIIAENNEVSVKDTIEKILKSDWVIPVPENVNGRPADTAAVFVPPKIVPRLWTTAIKTPAKANRNGAATTVANVMNMT